MLEELYETRAVCSDLEEAVASEIVKAEKFHEKSLALEKSKQEQSDLTSSLQTESSRCHRLLVEGEAMVKELKSALDTVKVHSAQLSERLQTESSACEAQKSQHQALMLQHQALMVQHQALMSLHQALMLQQQTVSTNHWKLITRRWRGSFRSSSRIITTSSLNTRS